MRLANQDLEKLTAKLGAQLVHARAAYAEALALVNAPDPAGRIVALFDPETYGAAGELALTPYQPIAPGVSFGFEGAGGKVSVTARPVASALADAGGSCDCEVVIDGGEESRWISLELEVDLQFVRTPGMVTVSLFGSMEVPGGDFDAETCRVEMFCHDTDGTRRSLLRGSQPFVLPADHGIARADVRAALPQGARIDETRPAMLVIFLSPQATRVTISDLALTFG